MEKLADISSFEGLGNCGGNSGLAVFNADKSVWSSPAMTYDVIERDDGTFAIQYVVKGSDPKIVGKFKTAQEAIKQAKVKIYGD